MLDDYNLRMIGPDSGPRFVEVPDGHPAFAELLDGCERPIGATERLWTNAPGGQDPVYVFTYEAWLRVAARQQVRFQTTSDPEYRPVDRPESAGPT